VTRRSISSLLWLAGCTFQPSPLAPASADAALADALPDAPLADAPAADAAPPPPDAEVNPCPVEPIELALGVAAEGAIGGPSRYEPTCTVGRETGGEDIYVLDVPAGGLFDLVVDLDEKAPDLDAVVDVTPFCLGQPQPGANCEDTATTGAGEVVVVEFDTGGRRYVAVDSVEGGGAYSVVARRRLIVDEGEPCAPDLTTSRCGLGAQCIDDDDDGVATCETRSTLSDTDGNDSPCTTPVVFADDGVFHGSVEEAGEPDVIALDPPGDRRLRVTVHDGRGGCAVDTRIEVLVGSNCNGAKAVADDDDSGLGSCPRLSSVELPGGQRSWLRIVPADGARIRDGASYQAVIDFLPP
jgi:hypothetical protein